MNANQIIRLLMRLFRPLLNRGLTKGIDLAARRGKPEAELTPEERAQAKGATDLTKRARQMARFGRRIGRF